MTKPMNLLVNQAANNAAKPAHTKNKQNVKAETLAQTGGAVSNAVSPSPQGNQEQAKKPEPQYTKSTPVDEIYRVMKLEDAKKYNVDVGNYIGKTLEQVAQDNPDKVKWYIDSYKGPNNILRAAAKIVHEVATYERQAAG